jgi:hypothetical protein
MSILGNAWSEQYLWWYKAGVAVEKSSVSGAEGFMAGEKSYVAVATPLCLPLSHKYEKKCYDSHITCYN